MAASSSEEHSPPKRNRTRPRQQPGLACEECRSRKLRCDRVQPQCGTCMNLGIVCTQNKTHQPRGPKRGYISALQSRIAALECRLGESAENNARPQGDSQAPAQPGDSGERQTNSRPPSLTKQDDYSEHAASLNQDQFLSQSSPQEREYVTWQSAAHDSEKSAESSSLPSDFGGEPYKPTSLYSNMGQGTTVISDFSNLLNTDPSLTADISGAASAAPSLDLHQQSPFGCTPGLPMSDLIRADLDHLYFDRVHRFVPIVNQSRYFARAARSAESTEAFNYLQYAMWTLAASMGSQFQHVQSTLYTYTRSRLEFWELDVLNEYIPIEQVQAWILIAFYELMQVNCQRGWISAGRCSRLVHLMRLHEIDSPNVWSDSSHSGLSLVEMEERRRTFWAAYSLDQYASLINQLPLRMNEQLISTRLPAPERTFQLQESVQTDFLAQVISGNGTQQRSSFAESIILLTLSGRCLSHQLQCTAERVYDTTSQEFLRRHQWLHGILSQKTQDVSSRASVNDELFDPIRVFTDMAAQVSVLLLSTALESVQWDVYGYQDLVSDYKVRAELAARNMSALAQQLAQLGYFKVHPITPILLCVCAQFAHARQAVDARYAGHFRAMYTALRNLCPVNNLAKTCLMKINPDSSNENVSTLANHGQLSMLE